jgi:AraC family transcriptional regulator
MKAGVPDQLKTPHAPDRKPATPHRHVVLRRLERGITLLKKPGKSVAEVADRAGFATPAHFIATFRRTMGVTPGAFQAALQR